MNDFQGFAIGDRVKLPNGKAGVILNMAGRFATVRVNDASEGYARTALIATLRRDM